MQTLTELENSVTNLSDGEYIKFRNWFLQQENEGWDTQLEKDIAGNKLENLESEALKDYRKLC